MKQSTYKILNLAILLFSSLLVLNAANIDEDYSKVIEKSFNISKDGIVMLKNKFGNMNVKTWSDNKVDIRVSIEVDVKDEAKAKKIFEAIDIAFENKADFVSAVTEFNTKDLKLKKDEKLSINYDVSMPASCFLDATNKYGNLVTESLDNGAHISVSYGSARADEIGGDLELKLAYASKKKFEGMADLDAVLKYSELEIEAMQNGTIVSNYS